MVFLVCTLGGGAIRGICCWKSGFLDPILLAISVIIMSLAMSKIHDGTDRLGTVQRLKGL